MSVSQGLEFAILKEKFAHRLYHELTLVAPTQELAQIFQALAHEEANHKVRLEIEYDDYQQQQKETDAG